MSEIDSYQHECIGMLECPSSFLPNNEWRHPDRMIPIYRLDEDAFDANTFRAKKGDLMLGGGAGECAALRISIPAVFHFLTHFSLRPAEYLTDDLYKAYWTIDEAFIFGEGYFRAGWRPYETPLELWLTEHIVAFVLREYPEAYRSFQGTIALFRDGSICRKPTADETEQLK